MDRPDFVPDTTLREWGFTKYRRTSTAWLRPHEPGEDMSGISVSDPDRNRIHEAGGMVAINPADPADQWYVNRDYFRSNFAEDTDGTE